MRPTTPATAIPTIAPVDRWLLEPALAGGPVEVEVLSEVTVVDISSNE